MQKLTSRSALVLIVTSSTIAMLMQFGGGGTANAAANAANAVNTQQPPQPKGPAVGTWMRLLASTTGPGHSV